MNAIRNIYLVALVTACTAGCITTNVAAMKRSANAAGLSTPLAPRKHPNIISNNEFNIATSTLSDTSFNPSEPVFLAQPISTNSHPTPSNSTVIDPNITQPNSLLSDFDPSFFDFLDPSLVDPSLFGNNVTNAVEMQQPLSTINNTFTTTSTSSSTSYNPSEPILLAQPISTSGQPTSSNPNFTDTNITQQNDFVALPMLSANQLETIKKDGITLYCANKDIQAQSSFERIVDPRNHADIINPKALLETYYYLGLIHYQKRKLGNSLQKSLAYLTAFVEQENNPNITIDPAHIQNAKNIISKITTVTSKQKSTSSSSSSSTSKKANTQSRRRQGRVKQLLALAPQQPHPTPTNTFNNNSTSSNPTSSINPQNEQEAALILQSLLQAAADQQTQSSSNTTVSKTD